MIVSDAIFVIQDDGALVAVTEAPYDSEAVLQDLLARYPDVLATNQASTEQSRRWLLVAREMPVPDRDDGAGRFSADHLFVDQDAVPTIVEVKRSTDTRIRREVVGQMLDYAANGIVYWPVEKLRSQFEATCNRQEIDPDIALGAVFDEETDPDVFWSRVGTNLRAGKIRMIFIADQIPPELQRIVEFLNGQMSPAEVLAIEVRQYVGKGIKTLVPRVIGRTAEAEAIKPAVRTPSDEASLMAALAERCSREGFHAFRRLLAFTKGVGGRIVPGTARSYPSVAGRVPVAGREVTVWNCYAIPTNPTIEIGFDFMQSKGISPESLHSFAQRLRAVPSIAARITDLEEKQFRKRPSLSISRVLAEPETELLIEEAITELMRDGTTSL